MSAPNIANCSLRELRTLLDENKISAPELAQLFRARAKQYSHLNAFLRINENDDYHPAAGNFLDGLPIAHKDIFCAQGEKTTCGSKMLAEFVAPYDSTVVENFRNAGMNTIGRTNMDEFAMGSSGEHSAFSASRNPWDENYVPGGSSSGSAAAVAARLTPVATATDTGGSIRQPAAFCGVTGIKPTYGRVSRWGMVAFASSFDQGGVIAKSAEDCALALSAMAGFDERDSTSLPQPAEDFTRQFDQPLSNIVIGVPKEFFSDGLDNEVASRVQEAIRQFEKQGATIKEISLASVKHAIAAYYVLTCAEASSNLSRYDGVRYGFRPTENNDSDLTTMYEQTRTQGFGAEVKRRILIGTYMLSYGYYDAYYRRAMKVRTLIARDFEQAFTGCDVLLGPTTPSPAFALNAIADNDPVAMYLQDIYTVPVNLAGLPALSLPCGFSGALPVGLQLIGAPLAESLLLSVAHEYQKQNDYHLQMPAGVQ